VAALINDTIELGWVDIEEKYFQIITKIFKKNFDKNDDILRREVIKVNTTLSDLKTELNKYVAETEANFSSKVKESASGTLKPLFSKLYTPLANKDMYYLILNFNYTKTFEELAIKEIFNTNNIKIVNIHGLVSDSSNPIIFGFGDDNGKIYNEMEEHGERELRSHIKSFYYNNTSNYKQLLGFIDSNEFDVHIVGHSCGISDKTLLNTIFEHNSCVKIKKYHYQGLDEDFNKRLELSRHFKNKPLMRRRVDDFDVKAVIPQLLY
jgi:hypothetical protein